jgi:competence protein ComEA
LVGLLVGLLAAQGLRTAGWGARPTEVSPSAVAAYQVDLNHADRAELLQLPGVGPNLADRIVAHRQTNGSFRGPDDLTKVHGIGPATMERLSPWVGVQSGPASDEPRQPRDDLGRKARAKKNDTGLDAVAKKLAGLAQTVDINRASPEELQRLPGIGPKMAQRIIDERKRTPFRAIEDLRRVSGIGDKTLRRLLPFITVGNKSWRAAQASGSQEEPR